MAGWNTMDNKSLVDALKRKPCMACHNRFEPCHMRFARRDDTRKRYSMAKMFLLASFTTIIKELNRCDLLCINCYKTRVDSRWLARTTA